MLTHMNGHLPWQLTIAVCVILLSFTCSAQEVTTAIIGDLPSAAAEEEETERNATGRRRERVELVDVSGWDRYYDGSFTVDPNEVTILRIPVPEKDDRLPARYNITFVIPEHPEGCTPNTTLWFSPAVYYKELCMERDFMGVCTLPSEDGFRKRQDLVDNYYRFKRVLFDYEWYRPKSWEFRVRTAEELRRRTVIKKTVKGIFCYDDRDYWMAFTTSCPSPIDINVQVGIKDLRFYEKWTCSGFDHFMIAQHGSDAFFTSRLFWAIVVPIGYFIFLFSLIFSCCYFFQCGAQGRASMLLKINLSFDFGDTSDSEDESRPTTSHHHQH